METTRCARSGNAYCSTSHASRPCLLRHLWATDGSIHLDHGKRRSVSIYYASSSCKLACHVQSLLLRLGINALLSCQPQGRKGRDQYHVTVSGRAEVATFFALVGG